jgi:ribosomal protein S18 acetylase RimI-like enzyme
MKIIRINELRDAHEIIRKFLSLAGKSLDSFRYYKNRDISVLNNHILTAIGMDEDRNPVSYGHLDQENNIVWLGICVIFNEIGKGYGNSMMKFLIDYAKGHNIKKINLSVDVTNKAFHLYERYGFVKKYSTDKIDYYEDIL